MYKFVSILKDIVLYIEQTEYVDALCTYIVMYADNNRCNYSFRIFFNLPLLALTSQMIACVFGKLCTLIDGS